jgi:hypothetical protein
MTLCVTAIARNESPYLLEWTAYQRVIGADQIMIYDNGHDGAGRALLQTLHERDVITYVPWPGRYPHGPQIPAYDDALNRLRGDTEWVLFVDLDEFVVPLKTDQISNVLADSSNLDGMWFPWLIFGSSGEQRYRQAPIIERFQRRQHADDTTVTPVKSAVRPDRTTGANLHVHHVASPAYANPLGEREYLTTTAGTRRSSQLARGMDVARVHHYMTKSVEEWHTKVARGRADRGYDDAEPGRDLAEFSQWDRNEVEDTSALRFLPALNEELAVLRRLLERA